jgi:hypothetical protein
MFDEVVRSAVGIPVPAELDDVELIEIIQGWDRLASWAAAGQLAAVAELARRRPRSYVDSPAGHEDAGDPLVPEVSEFAVDEVASALRLSRPAAGARLHVAVELSRLPATAAALAQGTLDVPKVRAVVDAVAVLDPVVAAAVEDQVLPRAGRQTVGQLRAALSKAVLSADPAAAEARHERAVAGRHVTLRPTGDGMAELWALLPADAAVAVYQQVDTAARTLPRDGRSMDARRADAFVTSVLRPTGPLAAAADGACAWTALAADDQAPAAAAGTTPMIAPAGMYVQAPAAAGTTPMIAPAGVYITVPVETAVGAGDEPGELAGYGPVPASMARRLAGTGRAWRKVTTDHVTGAVTEIGRTAYMPSAALDDLVRVRDRTCRFPGCRQPARRCDLDHVVPWPAGSTTAGNLAALCRHHHRLKHQTQWTVRAGPADTLVWTSPAGHRYSTLPAS